MSKTRINLRLNSGEVVVVGPIERWRYLINVCEMLAEDAPEYRTGWLETANWIREWVEQSDAATENEYEDGHA